MKTLQRIIQATLILALAACTNSNGAEDQILFGLTLSEEYNNTCSSKFTITATEIDLVEDGDLAYNDTATPSSIGYYEQEICIFPNESFTGGPIEVPVTVENNEAGRVTFPSTALPTTLSFNSFGSGSQECFIIQRVNNSDDDPNTAININLDEVTSFDDEGIYRGENPCDISVNIEDDEGPRVRVSNMSNITEEPFGPAYGNGVDGIYSVQLLNVAPTADVTVPINSTNDPKNSNNREGKTFSATGSNPTTDCSSTEITSLTFPAGSLNTPQYICVKSQSDFEEDSDKQYVIQMPVTSSTDTQYDGLNPRDVTVINQNKDVIGFTYGGFGGSGSTSGSGDTTVTGFATDDSGNFGVSYSCFTVKLKSSPTSDVVLTLTSTSVNSDGTFVENDGTTPISTLTFNSGNWNVTQEVCVKGGSDASNEGNHDYDVGFDIATSDPGYSNSGKPIFRMRSCDNDVSNALILCNFSGQPFGTSGSRLVTSENGTSANIWLVTKSIPGGTVTVGLTNGDPSEGSVSSSYSVTNSTYNQMGGGGNRIRVTGVDDADFDGNINYVDTTALSTGALSANPPDVYIRNNDNEKLYTVTKTDGTTSETGATGTIEVFLNFSNTQTITVAVSCTDSTECKSVSPTSLVWTAGQSGSGFKKIVTITGEDDSWADGSKSFNVNFVASTTDPVYDPNGAGEHPASQSMTNTDDEPTAKAIFVTTGTYNGEMGGSAGVGSADAICNGSEKSGKPGGTYKAMLAGMGTDVGSGVPTFRLATTDGSTNAGQTNWVLGASTYYYLYTGSGSNDETRRIFVSNAHGLIPFSMNRSFTTSSADRFWTGMNANMTVATTMGGEPSTPNCNAWTFANHPVIPNPDFWANYGVGNQIGTSAISSGNIQCSNNYKLICVQQ